MPTIAEKWMKQGEERGIEKGIEKKAIEDALSFHHLGVSTEIISKATGLSMKRLEEIFKEEKEKFQ
jgi:predicted transposase/invertase (TIGR01784 family)